MIEKRTKLNVDKVQFDPQNPRIKKALEKYGGQINDDRIHFALKSAADGSSRRSSYNSLKDSIRASGGAVSPIIVVVQGGTYICIDGNTRLAVHKQFCEEGIEGNWNEIKATVLEDAEPRDIETIRVSEHLVGTREWPAYEKARYLHHLRNERLMSYEEMIALCGGNKRDIEDSIDAYHDMNHYYRDVVDDTAFHIDRFSGFVELQKRNIKSAIFEAGFELTDFGEWIRDGKIYRLADVRKLPKVLDDNDAKQIFLEGGPRSIEKAIQEVERKTEEELAEEVIDANQETADIYRLAKDLVRRIDNLPYSEIRILKNKEHNKIEEQILVLEDLSGRLLNLLKDVSE